MDEDKIEIKGEDNVIEVKEGENIEIKGDDNRIEVDAEKKDIVIQGDDNEIKVKDRVGSIKDFVLQKKFLSILTVRGRSALGTMMWSPLNEEIGMALIFASVKTDPITDI